MRPTARGPCRCSGAARPPPPPRPHIVLLSLFPRPTRARWVLRRRATGSTTTSAFSEFNAFHCARRCLTSSTRSQENSSCLAQSRAYDWISRKAIALAIAKQKAIPCKYGDGFGSVPPDMAQWVPDRHAHSYNMEIWRTDRRALSSPSVLLWRPSTLCLWGCAAASTARHALAVIEVTGWTARAPAAAAYAADRG